jgi:hypothetical protein
MDRDVEEEKRQRNWSQLISSSDQRLKTTAGANYAVTGDPHTEHILFHPLSITHTFLLCLFPSNTAIK